MVKLRQLAGARGAGLTGRHRLLTEAIIGLILGAIAIATTPNCLLTLFPNGQK
jgi:hypothetical protein